MFGKLWQQKLEQAALWRKARLVLVGSVNQCDKKWVCR